MTHFKEVNYIVEAKSDILTIYSIGIPNYLNYYEGLINIVVLNNMASTIEEVLKMLNITTDKLVNLHETKYGYAIRTLPISNPKKIFNMLREQSKNLIFTNFRILELRRVLDNIRNKTYNSIIETGYGTKQIRPDFLVIETDAISIKVPNKFTYLDNSEPSWDYDYLLYPTQNIDMKMFRVDEEVLSILANTVECEDTAEEIRNFSIPTDIKLLEGFTPNRYEISRMRLRDISIRTKAAINVILENEWQQATGSDYFGVYQQSRMARKNKASFAEIKYNSSFSKEDTFPSIYRALTGSDKETVNLIDTELLKKEINELTTLSEKLILPELEAILLYAEMKQSGTPEYTMMKYEDLEEERERARGEIFTANLALAGNLKTMMGMFKSVYAKADLSLFDYKYLLGGEGTNWVKMSFETKEVSITDGKDKQDTDGVQKEEVMWLTGKDLEVDQNKIHSMDWEIGDEVNF